GRSFAEYLDQVAPDRADVEVRQDELDLVSGEPNGYVELEVGRDWRTFGPRAGRREQACQVIHRPRLLHASLIDRHLVPDRLGDDPGGRSRPVRVRLDQLDRRRPRWRQTKFLPGGFPVVEVLEAEGVKLALHRFD